LELDAREAALASREATFNAVDRRLASRVEQLTALQNRLEALEKERKAHDEANWNSLVKTYETMKPRDAAAIFNDLDMPVLLPVVDRMKEAKVALILSAMQPERARQVTSELARMRLKANRLEDKTSSPPSGTPTTPPGG
jgi:flagellar motility protein MotE (MotC chaperone)